MIGMFFRFDKHIIDIDFHCLSHQWPEYLCHQSLVGCPGALQTKKHHIVAIQPVWGDEGHFFRIRKMHRNQMVAGKGVQK